MAENFDAIGNKALLPPGKITMDRLRDIDSMVVSQATSQCMRCCCFQPSINFVMTEGKNNVSPVDQVRQNELGEVGGWIAEESSLLGRACSACVPGARKTKYTTHSGPIPDSLRKEEGELGCCKIQWGPMADAFGAIDPSTLGEVMFTHEKEWTNGVTAGLGDMRVPCCCNLPYLETKDTKGKVLGKTEYVCDMCLFVPKFDVKDGAGNSKYRIRPDTCVGGLCVMCRCGGQGGKCCRVPFFIRDPVTQEPVKCNNEGGESNAQITSLWMGMKRCCQKKNA